MKQKCKLLNDIGYCKSFLDCIYRDQCREVSKAKITKGGK